MKNLIKALISVSVVLVMIISVFTFSASAAGTVISFNKSSLSVGDSLTVTVTFNAGEEMYAVQGVINYDSGVLEYKSGAGSGGAGTLRIVESPSGEKKVAYTLKFTAKKAGSSNITVSDCFFSGLKDDKALSGASANVSVKDVSLSSNANLKSLYLSAGALSPAFSASVTSYTVNVDKSVTECLVSAVAAESEAKVEVTGSKTLEIGKNIRSVIVTAPSGASKTYTITIIRSETDGAVDTPETTGESNVSVEGVDYSLAADISSVKLFGGFTAATADYKGSTVAVAEDELKNYIIYYLKAKDSNELIPYTYDEVNDVFEKLLYFTQGEKTYIFADIPADKTIPDTYYTTNAKIGDADVKCYALSTSGFGDFYYVYCYSDGEYGFYRYDSRDGVLQRYPELEFAEVNDTVQENAGGFIARFKTLDSNSKIIVISFLFIILAAIALVVLLIVRFVKIRNIAELNGGMTYEEDFENVLINDEPEEEENPDSATDEKDEQ